MLCSKLESSRANSALAAFRANFWVGTWVVWASFRVGSCEAVGRGWWEPSGVSPTPSGSLLGSTTARQAGPKPRQPVRHTGRQAGHRAAGRFLPRRGHHCGVASRRLSRARPLSRATPASPALGPGCGFRGTCGWSGVSSRSSVRKSKLPRPGRDGASRWSRLLAEAARSSVASRCSISWATSSCLCCQGQSLLVSPRARSSGLGDSDLILASLARSSGY
jgi:hypothetical protein